MAAVGETSMKIRTWIEVLSRLFALGSLFASILTSPSVAGARDYCELFAKHTAAGKTGVMPDADKPESPEGQAWERAYRQALTACMGQFASSKVPAPTPIAKP